MAESNQGSVRFATETDWGETPAAVSATEARITSEALAHNKQTVISQEVRSDREIASVLEVAQSAAGPINFELSYGDHEVMITNALRTTLASARVASISTVFASTSFTVPSTINLLGSFSVGQWVRVTDDDGATTASTAVQISSLTSTVANVIGQTFASVTTTSATILGRTVVNGTTKGSMFLETSFQDITAVKYFTGMRVDTLSLNIQSAQIVTGTFGFTGKRGFTASTTKTSVVVSAGTTSPMTAAVNVGTLMEASTALANAVQSITLNISNNMFLRPQVGSKATANPGDGSVQVDGTLTAFFEDISLYEKMIDHTTSNLSMRFTDAANNMIVLTVHALKFSAGDPAVPGLNQDVFLPLNLIGFKHAGVGKTVRFDFLPASF